ncbi:uncharacterized protein MELLADRAFT_112475 [Melampsora larici-populina 98AG31]|uniref:Secreted protein n=1 Tax=Melampsora larici-populina (strain 98AG31 / pathotype 3-4-7) TaxID=747676 RepID=F4S6L2_MELLP|nr:uncharacterized protein MELLADRAFT_112475 [Melampsora larici-populina 98AG31]EGF99738.1 hypothetical protein MELLADRAFT_112475 [Melampsora larici-populina 98AG31]
MNSWLIVIPPLLTLRLATSIEGKSKGRFLAILQRLIKASELELESITSLSQGIARGSARDGDSQEFVHKALLYGVLSIRKNSASSAIAAKWYEAIAIANESSLDSEICSPTKQYVASHAALLSEFAKSCPGAWRTWLLIILVLLTIFVQVSLGRRYSISINRLVTRDTLSGQNQDKPQTCKIPHDNDPQTNWYTCLNEKRPVNLNDCHVAAEALMLNKWTDAGYGTCGVFFCKPNKDGSMERTHPDSCVTLTHIHNSLNTLPETCCPETRPQPGTPTLADLGPSPQGLYFFATGSLLRNYSKATRLDEADFQALVRENSHSQ